MLRLDDRALVEACAAMQPACIVCLGNELARDDGAGMRIGRLLQLLPLPEHVHVRMCPQIDLDLIDHLLTAQRFILCDATRLGLAPGTITVHDWQSAASLSTQPYCCHGIGLSDLITIAAELSPTVARWNVHVVGVEAQSIDEFGTHLSEEVEAALPEAFGEVLKLLAAPPELHEFAEKFVRNVRAPGALDAASIRT